MPKNISGKVPYGFVTQFAPLYTICASHNFCGIFFWVENEREKKFVCAQILKKFGDSCPLDGDDSNEFMSVSDNKEVECEVQLLTVDLTREGLKVVTTLESTKHCCQLSLISLERVSESYINVTLYINTRTIDDGPSNFEPWSSDEDDI
ncbi:hypothetical protein TNCV_1132711 [Trichonephila clavipes]|nr:hypothetical protein TNCV_1132711 [Trichonephila clavipes]